MKRMTAFLSAATLVAVVAILGCSRQSKADLAAVQGTWKGDEPKTDTEVQPSLTLAGNTLEFRGSNPNEWYKATYTLRGDTTPKQMVVKITECPFPKYVGKTAFAIYKIDGNALTIAANEPGNPNIPKAFNARGVRQIVVKRE